MKIKNENLEIGGTKLINFDGQVLLVVSISRSMGYYECLNKKGEGFLLSPSGRLNRGGPLKLIQKNIPFLTIIKDLLSLNYEDKVFFENELTCTDINLMKNLEDAYKLCGEKFLSYDKYYKLPEEYQKKFIVPQWRYWFHDLSKHFPEIYRKCLIGDVFPIAIFNKNNPYP
jgi:hypothetical protein